MNEHETVQDIEDRNFPWPTEDELNIHRRVRHLLGEGIPTPDEILDELEEELKRGEWMTEI